MEQINVAIFFFQSTESCQNHFIANLGKFQIYPEIYVSIVNCVGKVFVRMKLWQLAGIANEIFLKLQKANLARCRLTLMFVNRNNLAKLVQTTWGNTGEKLEYYSRARDFKQLLFLGAEKYKTFLTALVCYVL